jgi:hypothetical protein
MASPAPARTDTRLPPVPGAGYEDGLLPAKRAWISVATALVVSIAAGLLIWYVQTGP